MNRSRRFHRRQTILTWLTVCLLVLLQVQFLPTFSTSQSQSTASNTDELDVQAQYASLPLAFEPNQGQVDGAASFLVHHGQATTYFDGVNTTTSVGDSRVTMSLDGTNTPSFIGTDQLESKTNYFIGNDQSKWHSDVPNYKQLLAKNVYPGIDLRYYGTNSQLEHDFIVSPGTDYKLIAFHFDGQENVSLDKDGNLVMKTGESELRLNAPVTYQQTANTKHTIPSQFELKDNTITIALNADYDHSQPLVIDPALVYSTYLGGTGDDQGNVIAVDPSGNVYVVGNTASTNFPTTTPYQGSNAGGTTDVFVAKLNATGSAIIYSTYLGGSALDAATGLAIDSSGNVYIGGSTASTNFPMASAIDSSESGTSDAFITKLNAAGSALVYSTYLGGTVGETIRALTIDTSNNVYVAGFTSSSDFPTVAPFQAASGGVNDVFVAKLNSTGTTYLFSTYLGGSSTDEPFGIAIDSSSNIYIAGRTSSTNFPTSSPFQASNAGGAFDAFVTKMNPAGSALTYSTYLGGTLQDYARGLAVDTAGSAYLVGFTSSTNFPTSSPFQASNGGGQDAFISKFNPAGSALTYSTYLGGTGSEDINNAAVDSSGNLYISGNTSSSNFPTVSPFQSTFNGGTNDATVAKINPSGSALVYSTYLGGNTADNAISVAIGINGDAYLVGRTSSTNFPTASPLQASNAGGAFDTFIIQMTEHSVNLTAQVNPTLTFTVGSTNCILGTLSVSQTQQCTYSLTAATNGTSGYTISYLPVATLTSGANTINALSSLTASTLNTEQFGINLRANTAVGSNTASPFGADVSGGSGVVSAAYNTADSFKLVVAGDTIASTPAPSLTSTYTVSTIANIGATTEAGAYTTTLTYNIVAGY
jgi:hypothetical protein